MLASGASRTLGVSGINKENIWDLLLIGTRKNASHFANPL